jgi:hypothetical protein
MCLLYCGELYLRDMDSLGTRTPLHHQRWPLSMRCFVGMPVAAELATINDATAPSLGE